MSDRSNFGASSTVNPNDSHNFGTRSTVNLLDLDVGDIIFAEVKIDLEDFANTEATSGTANKIRQNKAVSRYCVVLSKDHASVTVTYLATFSGAQTLKDTLKEDYWYPVAPAPDSGKFDALPALNTKAQWVSLRTKQFVRTATAEKHSVKVTADWVTKVLGAMKE